MVDFENVQPDNVDILRDHKVRVMVFVGASQNKVSVDLAESMQPMGEAAEYVRIEGNGKNALDFHIAYYIGKISQEDPDVQFHVISKDTGFDPLIRFLRKRGVKISRSPTLAEITKIQISNKATDEEKIELIVKNLVSRGQHRPRKVETLANTISSLFKEKLPDQTLSSLVNELEKRKLIIVSNGRVTYRLPQRSKPSAQR